MDRHVKRKSIKRRSFVPGTYHLQNGVTLLSLMAGLLISTLSVLASISAYQNLRSAAAITETGLVHDSQIAATLLKAENYVTQAGYGIPAAGADDIKVVSVPASSTSESTISLLWRYDDGTAIVCRGIKEIGVLVQSKYYRTLKSIGSSGDCNASADLETLAWDDDIALLGQWPVTADLAIYLTLNETLIDFQVAPLTCSPYGYGVPDDHLSVTISMPGIARLGGAVTAGDNESTICLSNMYPT